MVSAYPSFFYAGFLQGRLKEVYRDGDIVFTAVSKAKVESLTARQFISCVRSFAVYLHGAGVRRGHRVMTSLSHNFDWNIIESAIFQLGAIHVPLSPTCNEEDIADKIAVISPALLIANAAFHYNKLGRVLKQGQANVPLIRFSPDMAALQVTDARVAEVSCQSTPDSIAVILFTSGSSMKSKAVPLTFRNMFTSVGDFSATDLFSGVQVCLDILHHSFSGDRKVNYSALMRGRHICYANTTLSITGNIDFYKAELVTCVPYLAVEILAYLQAGNELKSLKKIICGGAALDAEVVAGFREYGVDIYDVYGLTETASLCAYNTAQYHKAGSVGRFSGKIEYKLNGKQELLLKGDSVFQGYYSAGGISKVSDEQGWFNTGDIAQIDDEGYLFLLGRSSGAVKSQKGKFVD
jgi:long-subunit acyl-CoA synthetase (AMP-forming)